MNNLIAASAVPKLGRKRKTERKKEAKSKQAVDSPSARDLTKKELNAVLDRENKD